MVKQAIFVVQGMPTEQATEVYGVNEKGKRTFASVSVSLSFRRKSNFMNQCTQSTDFEYRLPKLSNERMQLLYVYL